MDNVALDLSHPRCSKCYLAGLARAREIVAMIHRDPTRLEQRNGIAALEAAMLQIDHAIHDAGEEKP